MLLSWLPYDVLLLIAENIPNKSDINGLARTNRRLYAGLNAHLYRRDARSGAYALFWAAKEGRVDIAQLSLAAGASLGMTVRDRTQNTPVLQAAHYGQLAMLDFLLSHPDADINAQDRWGRTPLILAVENDNEAIARRLLCYPQIQPNMTNYSKLAKYNFRPGITRPTDLLLGCLTALAYAAVLHGRENLVELLLQTPGVDFNCEDAIGRTPLGLAAHVGHEAVLKRLLARPEVSLNHRDRANNTPLSYAAFKGLVPIVSLLLDKDGIELDPANDDGETPLHLAAAEGHVEMVRLLLSRGSNINNVTQLGINPTGRAIDNGHDAVVELIRSLPNYEPHLSEDPDYEYGFE
jgi:ankyrin repeat protein